MRSPCDKRSEKPTFGNAHAAWWAAQGYVMVVQDSRGRFASDGNFYPFLREMEDGYDSVQWAAHLPGSDGQVAMIGFSYVGATQLLAGVMPPSLRAIAPDFTARLCVVDPGGTSVNLQEGILRARYRNSLSEPELMSPARSTNSRSTWRRSEHWYMVDPVCGSTSRAPTSHRGTGT